MTDSAALQRWIGHVFDHPASTPEWYWSDDAPEWPDHTEIPTLTGDTFERAGDLLARFPDDQVEQGFWYLIGATPVQFTEALLGREIPVETRLRAVRSFVPLFEQVMAVRCSPLLSHLDEQPASPLNGSCYMWWDLLLVGVNPANSPEWPALFAEIVSTMRRILAIPHDACRESALHGLGHLSRVFPLESEQYKTIIDEFLTGNPNLRPELIAYAERARSGRVL